MRALSLLPLLGLAACARGEYGLRIVTGDQSVREAVLIWEVYVLSGGCSADLDGRAPSTDRILVQQRWTRGSEPPELGDLDPGRYAIYVRASDDHCATRWVGCADRTFEAGGTGAISVELASISGAFCVADAQCSTSCGCGALSCAWGCSEAGDAHCQQPAPSGGAVVGADLDPNGALEEVTLAPPLTLDTDDGSIDGVRPAGTGVIGGIGFAVRGNVGVFTFARLRITAGTLSIRGRNAAALVSQGEIDLIGIIDALGDCVGNHPGPGGGAGGMVNMGGQGLGGGGGGAGQHDDASGGAGGGHAGAGGAGGEGETVASSVPGAAGGDPSISILIGGSGGGGGGGTAGGLGGGGGGAVQLVAGAALSISGGINAGGCGGRGARSGAGNADDGGGGGGSGGTILLEASSISLGPTAVLAANGGGGGGGDSDGFDGEAGTLSRAPAVGGSGSGGGGRGSGNGGLQGEAGQNDKNGGGGGGGAGRIRLNTRSAAATIDPAAVLSPGLQDPGGAASQGVLSVR
ncbi:MAG: hypothetical protein IT384_23745 [Deltaproteobacteria bacterium]|nr:hypothetical protein [Deltaproteobacteria bacterium]